MGKIIAVCISEKKGTQKRNIQAAKLITDFGIENDAHAGKWHRQVSLLSFEKISDFKAKGADITDGAFGENLIVEGFDLSKLPIGTRFKCNDVILELTQVGKECHSHCQIYKIMGDCIMPREGVFTKVIRGGRISAGDTIDILKEETAAAYPPGLSAVVITVSDTGYDGKRKDLAGPAAERLLQDYGYEVIDKCIIPDEQRMIEEALIKYADAGQADLIVTTGGTGFSIRDVTPEATTSVCERLVPGIPEVMRYESHKITNRAMLSRAVAGIRSRSLIINLPGSPKAARENLLAVLPALAHGLNILRGDAAECATPDC